MAERKLSRKCIFSILMGIYFAFVLTEVVEGMKCVVMIEVPDEWRSIRKKCFESHKANFTSYPSINGTLEEYDWEDNCQGHCFLKGIGIVGPDGALKPDSAATYYKASELSGEVLDKLTEIWNSCLAETEGLLMEVK